MGASGVNGYLQVSLFEFEFLCRFRLESSVIMLSQISTDTHVVYVCSLRACGLDTRTTGFCKTSRGVGSNRACYEIDLQLG